MCKSGNIKGPAVYLEIEHDIIQSIESQELKPHDQIMTEEQLCKKYKVCRMTVNKAIARLAAKGYVYRIPGKGSFVNNFRILKKTDARTSFSQDMASIGLKSGAVLLEYTIKKARQEPFIREVLNLKDNDIIHYFVRLRTGDDRPIALSYTYVSGTCIPVIDPKYLETSFYEYVDKVLKLKIGKVEGGITAVLPTKEQKEILGIKNEALLLNIHTTYLQNDMPMEYIKTYYIGTRYTYSYSQ